VIIRPSQSKGRDRCPQRLSSFALRPSTFRSSRGFALIVTITLLAFLLLVMVGLATFTKVETSVSDNALKQTQARQNALMALDIALGQLQKQAGPDTRVTATADSVAGATNLHYTGVWDSTTATVAPQTWLVSGNENGNLLATTPLNAANTVTLVDTGSVGSTLATDKVTAPLVPIKADNVPGQPAGTKVGNYAWWVGDQGVKAALNTFEDPAALTFLTAEQQEVARQMTPQREVGEAVFTALPGTTTATQQALQKVFAQPQYGLVTGIANVTDYFHTITPASFGVLASTASSPTGGLKSDLSIKPDLLPGTGFTNIAAMGSMVAPSASAPYRRLYKITAPATLGNGKVTDGIAPVLTQFEIGFSLAFLAASQTPSATTNLQLKAQLLAELWNPYTSELQGQDLELVISGLPNVTITYTKADNSPGSISVPLQGAVAGLSPLVVTLPMPSPSNQLFRFLPGRVLTWAGLALVGGKPTAIINSRSATTNAYNNLTFMPAQPAPRATTAAGTTGTATMGLSASSAALTATLRIPGGAVLATYTSPTFNSLASSGLVSTTLNVQFAYSFRLLDRIDYTVPPANAGDWLAGQDPREVAIASSSMTQASQLQPASNSSMAISQATSLFDRAASTGTGAASISYLQDVPVFELPRQPYTSVGQLQHLPIQGARAFSIGNSWGAAAGYNSYFDRFFFSGATTTALATAGANFPAKLPNLRLRPYLPAGAALPTVTQVQALPKARSPRYLLVDGAFNLNSTSVSAWKMVLGGVTVSDWPYVNASATDGAQNTSTPTLSLSGNGAMANAFFRFAQSGKETYSVIGATPVLPGPVEKLFYRPGVRLLTNAQRDSLAAAIVANIIVKQKDSGPFRTMEQFLAPSNAPQFGGTNLYAGKSLLEDAIAKATPAINVSTSLPAVSGAITTAEAIDTNSSSYLTQADIMTTLAPFVAPRSDTFLVRAYGETVNPVSNSTEGRAWCEALVQRLPEFFDSTQDPELDFSSLNTNNGLFGRKFKIISFRWLNSSDL